MVISWYVSQNAWTVLIVDYHALSWLIQLHESWNLACLACVAQIWASQILWLQRIVHFVFVCVCVCVRARKSKRTEMPPNWLYHPWISRPGLIYRWSSYDIYCWIYWCTLFTMYLYVSLQDTPYIILHKLQFSSAVSHLCLWGNQGRIQPGGAPVRERVQLVQISPVTMIYGWYIHS